MATTDAKSGFRLPWSSDRPNDTTDPADEQTAEAVDTGWPSEDAASQPAAEAAEAPARNEAGTEAPVESEPAPGAAPAPIAAPVRPKKTNKFLADLTKAMQAAAEDARSRALGQLQGEAKTHIESIHGRSATEAADLRRAADDDVAGIREWSKAEIARIREETEHRITGRKADLESEIEDHAAVIEHEIEAVQSLVAAFEQEMAEFFERLLAEEDPTRFATMAENLPEPPSFDDLASVVVVQAAHELVATEEPVAETATDDAEAVTGPDAVGEAEPVAETDAVAEAGTVETADEIVEAAPGTGEAEANASSDAVGEGETVAADGNETPTTGEAGTDESLAGHGEGVDGDGEVDREAAFAAIQAAAEAAASAEVAADAAARAEAVADVAIEIMGNHEGEGEPESDPRFAALGLSPDYDAAEAEALASAEASSDEEIPEIGDDALAARLAGLVPSKGKGAAGNAAQTQVVVVGLVSVASIASFKRHLGRVAGVQSVGVSSGPDGEFVFSVNHSPETNLRDAIPSLPSFQARVTSSADGSVHVTAHDPEADG
jgi:hypothetical protein